MAKQVDLVFRTVGERTSRLALILATESVQPEKVYVIENIKPFWRTVEKMLAIPFHCETVVFIDADCLILESLRPFLDENTRPHIDACVLDKFRGRVTAGVHIIRADVVERMRKIPVNLDDSGYCLKPESWIRNRALQQMGEPPGLKRFEILHDFEQYLEHIFIKLVLRELRSRKRHRQLALERKMNEWSFEDPDFLIAKQAVNYSRNNLQPNSGLYAHHFVCSLPNIARQFISSLGLQEKDELTGDRMDALIHSSSLQYEIQRPPRSKKIIGIGLSPTDITYLKWALEALGLTISPNYTATMTPNGFSLGISSQVMQNDFDGVIGVTLSPFYRHLVNEYPDGQFILVKGNREQWLREIETERSSGRNRLYRIAQQILLEQEIDSSAINWMEIYRNFYKEANEYLRQATDSFLLFDLTKGHSWRELCAFLKFPPIQEPFFG